MPATNALHWAATPSSWVRQGMYHTIVAGDGRIQRLHAYSVALCCACMGGVPNP